MEMLKNSKKSVQDIALECGFSDANYFSKVFKKKYNSSPSNIKKLYSKFYI